MSDTEGGTNDARKVGRRNLPSSFSTHTKGNRSQEKKTALVGPDDRKFKDDHSDTSQVASTKYLQQLSRLMEGVVFVLSGFVNPERSTLRSQGLEMGADYHPDWTSDCTLLVCAFPNTPKFKQVEADCGTIVSKEWISECYNQKRLIEIEPYLMHAGKPWRKQNSRNACMQNEQDCPPVKPHTKSGKSASPKGHASSTSRMHFSPSKIKEWALDDLNKTMAWLESQEEKPEPSELQKIASEGILTCLQDSIAAVKKNQGIQEVTEQWNSVPRVVEELAKLASNSKSHSREKLLEQASTCRHVYQNVYDDLNNSFAAIKKQKRFKKEKEDIKKKNINPDEDTGYDSDQTIEMSEDEIEQACKGLVSVQ